MKGSRGFRLYLFLIILCIMLGGCSRNSGEASEEAADKVEMAPLQSPGVQNLVFQSEALDREMRLSVYLPAGYKASQRYPVLYFIHGYGSKETDMFDGLDIQQNADRLIEAGQIEPLIIIAPQMDNSYGLNAVANPGNPASPSGERYEDYLVEDVVKYTDTHFNTLAERGSRYIGGISMGGFISLHSAFLHSDIYSKVGGHSPALFLDDWSLAGGENGLVQLLYPTEALRQERDPLLLAQNRDLSKLSIYLDCGAEDSYRFYEGTEQLYTLLKGKGVPVEYHLRAGQHDGDYWKSHMDEYLKFYAGRTKGS
ncbi:alpha/beta hydrolase-fold protein [Paenibacillus sp. FSL R7-0337]|uniref:alpha/beta hydrolase n=1 Tax=Paenibacillus sp. FSL R7-0337 TaxID=1926588 RepID=UPI0009FA9A84|nr:alpha/beta hydrolase-fold protein [Paenibacillus sp. FSL R7-0337]